MVLLKPVRGMGISNVQEPTNDIRMNPYDIPALLNGLKMKKENQECSLICACMGAENAKEILRRCIALGADQTILLSDPKFAGSDTYATSFVLSEAIKKVGKVDMVLCGAKSIDGETGQVPIELATRLEMRYLPHVDCIDWVNSNSVKVQMYDEDILETCRVPLPFVAIFNGLILDEPICSLLQLKRAQNSFIKIWDANDLGISEFDVGQKGSKTRVVSVVNAKRNSETHFVHGLVEEQCLYLYNILTDNV